MNIYQRLTAIKKEVAYIRKDKKVESYMAVTHDAVTAETRDFFIKHGVMIVPCELESKVVETGTVTARGTPFIRFEAKYEVSFVNIEDPADKVSVIYTAHALDHGDKAPGKAHSYAVKYAILKVLQIETGETEEGREDQKAPKKKKEQILSAPITPTSGAKEQLEPEQRAKVEKLASIILDKLANEDEWGALETYEMSDMDTDEKVYCWTFFDSKQRRRMKDLHDASQKAVKSLSKPTAEELANTP